MIKYSRKDCEFLREQAKRKFDQVRVSWCDYLRWTMPHRGVWLNSQTPGQRANQHIVDATHILAQRSFVAGFLEGNTSATRPWIRAKTRNSEVNDNDENKAWLQHFTQRTLLALSNSNYYHAAGQFYYDYSSVNTGAHYFEELKEGGIHVYTLMPGSYFVLNNNYNEACIMIREFALNVKALVEAYGEKDKNGKVKWDNFSSGIKKMYQSGNYGQMIDVVHVMKENPNFNPNEDEVLLNRKWIELTYELGGIGGHNFQIGQEYGTSGHVDNDDVFLKVSATKRKPFVVGKSTDNDFEYGEKGPTSDSLGLIKSLNKKAIGKDQALEQMLKPALQGPASLRKSYISHAPNTYVPIDARSAAAKQKLETIFEVNPGIGALIQDVEDLRGQVDKLYYADFLLYLSRNPKTRTATETAAVVEEQQRVIGPNLQSLNFSYNTPVVDWVMDYVLFEDPYLRPPPEALQGQSIGPEFISVFAQAQRAADLPNIDRYVAAMANAAQLDPSVLQKINTDKLADLYEDRLYLPSGLNNPQAKVEAIREQAKAEQQRQQAIEQTIPAMAKAAKDVSSINQG